MTFLFLQDKFVEYGGAETWITNKRSSLEKKGHATLLFALADEELSIKNSLILKNSVSRIFGSYKNAIAIYLKLRQYIKTIRPDVIYINNIYTYTFSFILACRGFQTIQIVHDYGILCPTRMGIYKDRSTVCNNRMGSQCLKHCVSPLIFISSFLKLKYIKHNGIIKKYICPSITLKNSLLSNKFKNVLFTRHKPLITSGAETIIKEKSTFLYIGGLFSHKGIFLLIDAMKEVVKKIPEARLYIIGKGEEEPALKNLVKKYLLKNHVSFLGNIAHDHLYRYYKKATATIVPSILVESYSLVVTESLYFGTWVIGSDIGGIKEQLTNNPRGILFRRNDRNDLIEKMLSCLH